MSQPTETRYSHDNDSTITEDTASIYSTSSSMVSTASRISKIPNAVKSSLKNLVGRNKNRSNETKTNESLTSKLKRATFNFSPSSSSSSPPSASARHIIPTTTASSTLVNNYTSQSKAKQRRNSVVNLASRFLSNTKEHEPIIDESTYIIHESDSKSENIIKKKEEPWTRQRAKSCQVDFSIINYTVN
jgi:pyruvate formate-lyase activating enzyme-like uncharacterized protein